jgi:hypothetical protein
MAIEIIDGFKVSSAVPVDNRIVASGSNARSAIAYKYEGLRVFDTFDSTPYVWLSNSWKKENQTALSAATVTPLGFVSNSSYRVGQILKVYDSDNTLTNSNIFEKLTLNANGGVTNRAIAINHIDGSGNNTPNTVSNTVQLDVKGVVKATSFEGIGSNITDISPLNFNTSTNKIKINQIEPGTSGYFLATTTDPNTNTSILKWLDLAAGFSPTSLTTVVDTASPTVKFLTFVDSQSNAAYRHFSSNDYLIGVIPQTGQIVVKNSNGTNTNTPASDPSTPPYSFINDQDTGIYNSAVGSVGISSNGSKKVEIDTNGIKIAKGNASNPGISFIGANNYGIYQTTTGNNRIGVVVAGDEVLRIKSTGVQGNGNTSIYGEGGLLSLIGNTHAFMEFYRTGSATPDGTGVVTPSGSNRSAYIGYPSGSTNFEFKNTSTSTYVSLLSTGAISINTKISGSYGVSIDNSGASLAYGLRVTSNFATGELNSPASQGRVIARYDSRIGNTLYASTYITSQGILLHGYSGVGTQTNFSGTAERPSLAFMGSGTTGLYSDSDAIIGFTSFGAKKVVINRNGVQMAGFESQDIVLPTVNAMPFPSGGNYNSGNANNTGNGVNTAYINAVKKSLTSNSGQYTARWVRLGFKFNAYTYHQSVLVPEQNKASQYVTFPSDTCDRVFYCGSGGNAPANWYGYEAKFYIGGAANGNYLGRFLSNNGASSDIYNGTGTFYVPANHVFTIVFEWYTNGTAVNDTSDEGGFAMEVRAFRMGLTNYANNGSF